jgi:hypothetical protein
VDQNIEILQGKTFEDLQAENKRVYHEEMNLIRKGEESIQPNVW